MMKLRQIKIPQKVKCAITSVVIGTMPVHKLQTNKFIAPLKFDVVDITPPSAQKLITYFENGDMHSAMIDGKKHFQVYYGGADKAADEAANRVDITLTVGHGRSGRGAIKLANGQKVGLGDYISENTADSLFADDISKINHFYNKHLKVKLKPYQESALLSYGYNLNVMVFAKNNPAREIPESMFECLNKNQLGKAQAKFDVIKSGSIEYTALMKRRLVEMIIFGNGEILNDRHAQKTFQTILKKLHKREPEGFKEVLQILKDSKLPSSKIEALRIKAEKIVKK